MFTVDEGITIIDVACFMNNESIEEIRLPNSIKHIRSHAFKGCKSLKTINLPEGLESIGI